MRFWRRYALVKQANREGPLEVWVRIGTYYYFLTQTFFLALSAPAPWGGGAQTVPLTIPPLPTPSPPFSRGERVGVKGDRAPMCRVPSGPSS